ncbi:succinate dehydrogenase hydrophobic membrane anchor subunit [Pseudolysinimonas sp.]|jgi:succinate dehydrogenase / fumarate reductase membrane anchor subunit|uniref:succinate dehydrogenase hydrophobic membrane anchor subunit n=1 Tax=Pseudolysinimonas sp. TaxID=2680009 RepID=UPI003784CFA9
MTAIPMPNERAPRRRRVNWEMWGWLYMRLSGVLLVVLIFGHLLVNLFLGDGVKAIDFAFVAGKLADPFWIVYDMLLLWLALIHGSNGMRTIINDYARGRLRVVFLVLLAISTVSLLVLGSLVLTTFDPCPAGTPADILPQFCSTL